MPHRNELLKGHIAKPKHEVAGRQDGDRRDRSSGWILGKVSDSPSEPTTVFVGHVRSEYFQGFRLLDGVVQSNETMFGELLLQLVQRAVTKVVSVCAEERQDPHRFAPSSF